MVPAFAAVGMAMPACVGSYAANCLCCCCCWWFLAAESLDTKHAGVGIAIFNAIGAAIGGFSGPWIVGTLVNRMGSFVPSMVFMGVFLTAGGVMLSGFGLWELLQRRKQQQQQPRQQQELKLQEGLAESCVVVKDGSFVEDC
jgi:dipeptide/tripeptide permease